MKRKKISLWLCALFIALLPLSGCQNGADAAPAPREELSQENTLEAQNAEIAYTFRNEKLFHSHFEKHGAEFGTITQEEYLQLANNLIASETALSKEEKEDGDTVFYEEEDNTFLVLSKDGYIRTFFKPSDGLDYYERQ